MPSFFYCFAFCNTNFKKIKSLHPHLHHELTLIKFIQYTLIIILFVCLLSFGINLLLYFNKSIPLGYECLIISGVSGFLLFGIWVVKLFIKKPLKNDYQETGLFNK